MTEVGAVQPDAVHIAQQAELLIRKIVALRTDNLRSLAASEELRRHSAPMAVGVLGHLMRARRDRPSAAACVDAIARALAKEEVDAEFVEAMRTLAQSRADRLVEALLATGPAARTYDQNEEAFVDRRLRMLTLGERRALARSRDIDLLLRLAHDQDIRVIQGLLRNPRFTEREAVIVASRRPTHASVLDQVLASRFGQSRRVRQAIAHNPYAPVSLAARAMASLTSPELEDIAADERVADEVRAHARALVIGRGTSPAERTRAAEQEVTYTIIDRWLTTQIDERSIDPADLDAMTIVPPDESD